MTTTKTQSEAKRGRSHFIRHYLEMVAAMFVGMAVLGTVTYGLLLLADLEFLAAYPEIASLAMAFDMSVGMVFWMRRRRHGWAPTLEMVAAMFVPALALFPLLWMDVITADALHILEHIVMLPLMFFVMLRRRHEYGW